MFGKFYGKPGVVLVALGLLMVRDVRGQSLGQSRAPAVGRVASVDPYAGGMAPAPPGYVYSTQGTNAAQSSTSLNRNMMDPLGLGYVYGAAVPMTPTQTGLYMLTMQQRMLGLGNGQLSGVRPVAESGSKVPQSRARVPGSHPGEAHTANMNVPGGQAARYFNRGGSPATSRSQSYYHRQGRYFPQTSQ
jgi:hypothetical protein